MEGKHSCEQPGDTQVCAECLLGTIVPLYWGIEPWFDPEHLRVLPRVQETAYIVSVFAIVPWIRVKTEPFYIEILQVLMKFSFS